MGNNSLRLRNRVKISHLSLIFNLGKIKRCQTHSAVNGCRVMGQGNRHMSSKRLYELEKCISAHQDKHGHGSIQGQWGSRRFRAHPWCAESPQGFLSSTRTPLLSSGEGAYATQEEGQVFDWTLLGLWSPGIRGSERGRSSGSGMLWCSS